MKRDEVFLQHIYDACVQIQSYADGYDLEVFLADRKTQDAIARQLEIIGEASRQLSDSFKSEHPDIPWQAIRSMRNRIAHDYINVDVFVVWEVTTGDIPTLRTFVEQWI